jgi:hypothetical protein
MHSKKKFQNSCRKMVDLKIFETFYVALHFAIGSAGMGQDM